MQMEDARIWRVLLVMFLAVGLNGILTASKTKEPEEIPVVYLPGISGPLENQQEFEETIKEIEKEPGITVAEEFALLDERMNYNREEKMKEAANVATAAVAVGHQVSKNIQDEMQRIQLAENKNPILYPVVKWDMSYTREDVVLLANIMYIEELQYTWDEEGEIVLKLAGSVPLHRLTSDVYKPNTLYGIIYEEGQYAWNTKDKIGKVDIPDIVYVWAEELLKYGPIGPENLVFQDSDKHGEVYYQYGNQYFCLSDKIATN